MPSYLSEHRQTWLTGVPVTGHSKEAGIIDVTSWQVSTHRENGVLVEQHSGRAVEKKIRPVITQAGDRGCVALLMVLLLTKHKQISQQAATAATAGDSVQYSTVQYSTVQQGCHCCHCW